MYVRLPLALALAGSLLAVAGCSNNPKEGGFFGGVGGLASGAYEDRIAEREARLDGLRAAGADLSGEQANLEAQERARQAQIAALRSSVARLDRDTQSLKRQVADLQAEDSVSASRLRDLQQRLSNLDRRIASVQSGADALEGSDGTSGEAITRRKALEAERQQLEREYKALLDLTRQLAS